jgi:hypothetical protein
MFKNAETGAVLFDIKNAVNAHVATLSTVIVASVFAVKIDSRNVDDDYIVVSKDDPFNAFAKQFLDLRSSVTVVADYVFYSALDSNDIADLLENCIA